MSAGKRKSEKAITYKIRKCLKCEGKFKSLHRFNRVCDTCKESAEWKSGYWITRRTIGEN